ncbi:MAG: glycosyltransferase family 4 protein [Oligoflexia bacterium]|nr:glycosyltransferase family 4 protein [Oligoflexia bacterium]
MNIVYDHQIFTLQKYGGISRYFVELAKAIEAEAETETKTETELAKIKIIINAYITDNQHLNDLKSSNLIDINYNQQHLPVINFLQKNLKDFRYQKKIFSFVNQQLAKKYIVKSTTSSSRFIYHPTYYNPYFLTDLGKTPFVLTVYDMIHEIYPHFFSKNDKAKEHKKILLHKANKIIAISHSTKQDLLKIYSDLDENKIQVIHLGPPNLKSKKTNTNIGISFLSSLPNRYILFVGQRDRYKNFNLFLKAISSLLLNEKENLSLVCAGGGEFTKEERNLFSSFGNSINNKIVYYSVNDESLHYLYKNAICFVFPSLYEGFGIPVLEAFDAGTPVVLSNCSSLPEIAGKAAACYFDPIDTTSILNAVTKVCHDKNLRIQMIKEGFEQLKNFSWKKTAKETLNIYKNLCTKF